jgi:hypothetical protein
MEYVLNYYAMVLFLIERSGTAEICPERLSHTRPILPFGI